jgi:phage-related protein
MSEVRDQKSDKVEQKYQCGKCGYEGTVYFTANDNVVSMCIKIAVDHEVHSPGCEDWEGQLRIRDQRSGVGDQRSENRN